MAAFIFELVYVRQHRHESTELNRCVTRPELFSKFALEKFYKMLHTLQLKKLPKKANKRDTRFKKATFRTVPTPPTKR
jgi:hypothetical protein